MCKPLLDLGVVTSTAFGAGAWLAGILPGCFRTGERVVVVLGGFLKPERAGLKLVFEAKNQRVYQIK